MAALILDKQHGKLNIVLRGLSEYDANGREKLEFINLGHQMYDPLAYPLIFRHGKDGWHRAQKHDDSRENSQKISPKNFYSRLLF